VRRVSMMVRMLAVTPLALALWVSPVPVDAQSASPCQLVASNVGRHQPGTTQVIVVLTNSAAATTGTLQVARFTPQGWVCGSAMTARLGRSGTRPLVQRRSGDGTTPAGVFPLGVMRAWDGQVFSFFGNAADPGVSAGAYRRVRSGDCFGATPNASTYGHLVNRSRANCINPDEYLPKVTGPYEHAALIGANMEPDVSGDAPGETPYAAGIFLHRHSYNWIGRTKPTSGCVSLNSANLVTVLRAMRPGVMFAIGDTAWLLANS
jgi:L,D-peptidoglycan transpeptidase YkuD (ErfK/YbiS/YcfS/YnhG family)